MARAKVLFTVLAAGWVLALLGVLLSSSNTKTSSPDLVQGKIAIISTATGDEEGQSDELLASEVAAMNAENDDENNGAPSGDQVANATDSLVVDPVRQKRYDEVLAGVDSFFKAKTRKETDSSFTSQHVELCRRLCKLPQCWANSKGICAPSPFYIKTGKHDGRLSSLVDRMSNQSSCPWDLSSGLSSTSPRLLGEEQLEGSANGLPALPGNLTRRTTLPYNMSFAAERLQAFQHLAGKVAGSGGQPHVPIRGSCNRTKSGAFRMTGFHEVYHPSKRVKGPMLARYVNTSNPMGTGTRVKKELFNPQASSDSGNYKIKNFCLSPRGGMWGYKPKMYPYDGRDDAFTRHPNHPNANKNFNEWLVNHTRPLRYPAKCYLDTKVVFVPVWSRAGNLVHSFHRIAKTLQIRHQEFGASSGSNILTVFVFPTPEVNNYYNNKFNEPMWRLNQTGFYPYLNMVSPSHVAVYGGDVNTTVPRWLLDEYSREQAEPIPVLTPPESTKEAVRADKKAFLYRRRQWYISSLIHRPLACFKEGVVYQNCLTSDCLAGAKRAERDDRPSYSTFFRRSSEVQDRMVKRLRECVGLKEQRETRRESGIRVLMAARGTARTLTQGPYLVAVLAHYLDGAKGELFVNEMGLGTTVRPSEVYSLVQLYSDMDVVIGPYGSGLFFSLFMPPGSVVAEFGSPLFHCAKSGINVNAKCDYGGDLGLANVHHVAAKLSAVVQRKTERSAHQANAHQQDIAPEVFVDLMDSVSCVREKGTSIPFGDGFTVRDGALATETCYHNPSAVATRGATRDDDSGASFQRMARMLLPRVFESKTPPVRSLSRLPWLVENAGTWTKSISETQSKAGFSVLLFAPCGIRQHVVDEVKVLSYYGAEVCVVPLPSGAIKDYKTVCNKVMEPIFRRGMANATVQLKSKRVAQVALSRLGDPKTRGGCRSPALIFAVSKSLLVARAQDKVGRFAYELEASNSHGDSKTRLFAVPLPGLE